jgi:conserved domain protein
VIHGMFVSGGALLVVYAAQVLKEKEEFRATLAPVWVVLNSILLVSQVRQGVFTEGNIRLILISIIPLFMATWLGKKLVKKVSQKVFLNLTYVLLLVSGLSLIL